MAYEKAEQGRKFAQIDILRLSFERKEMELMKNQRRIEEGNNLLKNAFLINLTGTRFFNESWVSPSAIDTILFLKLT